MEIHWSPKIYAPVISKLSKGSAIKYDVTMQGPKPLGLRQLRESGCGYIVGKDKYGKSLGKFR